MNKPKPVDPTYAAFLHDTARVNEDADTGHHDLPSNVLHPEAADES